MTTNAFDLHGLVKQMGEREQGYQSSLKYTDGVTVGVDASNSAAVEGRQDYIYVREEGSASISEIFNDGVPAIPNIPVKISYAPTPPYRRRVVGIDWDRIQSLSWYGGVSDYSSGPHHTTHEWPDGSKGSDVVQVYRRALVPFRTYIEAEGTLTISVAPMYWEYKGTFGYYAGVSNHDISAHLPDTANQVNYVLVYFDTVSETLKFTSSSHTETDLVTWSESATVSDHIQHFPSLPDEAFPSAVLVLYNDLPAIQEGHIIDVRSLWDAFRDPNPLTTSNPSVLTIDLNASITVTSDFHLVSGGGLYTVLSTINAEKDYQMLLLKADIGETITVEHSAGGIYDGNIFLNGEADVTLSGEKTLLLFYDGTNWSEVAFGSGGTQTLQAAYEGGPTIVMTAADGDIQISNDGGDELLFLDEDTGRVGIGTTAPTELLDVRGIIKLDNTWLLQNVLQAGVARLNISAVGPNDAAELFLHPTGTATTSRITVTDGPSITNYAGIAIQSTIAENTIESIQAGTGVAEPLKIKMDGTDIITIQPDGDVIFENGFVGIGTAAPSQLLHLDGVTGGDHLLLEGGSNTSDVGLVFETASGRTGAIRSRYINPSSSTETRIQFLANPTGGNDQLNTTVMTLTGGGQVGIGTGSPMEPLHIAADLTDSPLVRFDHEGNKSTGEIVGLQWQGRDSGGGNEYVQFFFEPNTAKYGFGHGTISGNLPIQSGISNADITIDGSTGGVGIGTGSPSVALDVQDNVANYVAQILNDGNASNRNLLWLQGGEDTNPNNTFINFNDGDGGSVGSISGDGAGGVNYGGSSDKRIKQDITDLLSSLDKILALRPVEYRGKGAPKSRPKVPGFIAQEVRDHIPEMVHEDEDGMLSLAWNKIIPHMARSIQELESRVAQLEAV